MNKPPPSLSTPKLKPYPAGTYCLLASNKPINPVVLDRPIKGFRTRTTWADLQPDLGTINYDYLDAQIALADLHNCKIGLGVAAGVGLPHEAFERGVYKFTLSPDNVTIENLPPDMALPWDEAFHDLWFPVIDELAATYDGLDAISYVVISGMMQLAENRYVMEQNDVARVDELARAAGYDDFGDAYLDGAQKIIRHYCHAFPRTVLILTTARVAPGHYKELGDELVQWAKTEFPQRFGTMTCTLKAHPAPYPAPTEPLPNFPKGDQPIYNSKDVERFYLPEMTPVPFPDAPQPVDDLLGHAVVTAQDMWVELYEADAKNAVNDEVVTRRNLEFEALAQRVQQASSPA